MRRIVVFAVIVGALGSVGFIAKSFYSKAYERKDWVKFEVAKDSRNIKCRMRAYYNGLSICNRETLKITNVLVQINHEYVLESPDLEPNACTDLVLTRFRKPDWRRIPAPENLSVDDATLVGRQGAAAVHCWSLSRPLL